MRIRVRQTLVLILIAALMAGMTSYIEAQSQTLSKNVLGAVVWGEGKAIQAQIHLAKPVIQQSSLWIVPTSSVASGFAESPPTRLSKYLQSYTKLDCQFVTEVKDLGPSVGLPPEDSLVEVPVGVPLVSERIFSLPLLLCYGTQPVTLTSEEITYLRQYLVERGGFLFADEGDTANQGFLTSIKEILKQVLPGYPVQFIPPDHEIYHRLHSVNRPPRGRASVDHALEGVFINGRLAVLLSDRGYSTYWAYTFAPTSRQSSIEEVQAVFQFSANVVLYAVTHGHIADYSKYTP